MNYKMNNFFVIILIFFTGINLKIYGQSIGLLDKYDITGANVTRIELPNYLDEVSGLANYGSSKLLMHDDENGIIYIYDLKSTKIERKVRIGNKKIREDFEGIAANGDTVFLSTSNGKVYSTLLNDNNKTETIFVEKMNIKDKINLEGLCYTKINNSLILPNKIEISKKHSDERVLFSFDVGKKVFSNKPLLTISLKELKKKYDIDNFSPTAIEIHPMNYNYFILSSHEKCIVELSPDGEIINALKLDGKNHRQPEGLTFLDDLSLVISDEASGEKAELTIIPFGK